MTSDEDSFEAHLRNAIALNISRRSAYFRAGGLRAWAILSLHICAERACLVPSKRWDREARSFQEDGVPIIRAELAQMRDVPHIGRVIADCAAPDQSTAQALKVIVKDYRCEIRQPIAGHDLRAIEDATRIMWHRLQAQQRETRLQVPLLMHVLESLGAFALHGQRFGRRTEGRSVPLSVRVIKGHAKALRWALWLDIRAWPLHHKGIGLLINDLPPIAFPQKENGDQRAPASKSLQID